MTSDYPPSGTAAAGIVFLVDVDNTLLDNDRLISDLMDHIALEYGTGSRDRYAQILEDVRSRLGYVDYLGALQQFRLENLDVPELLGMSGFLIDYPFAQRLYPGALHVLAHLQRMGTTVILSDGDVVFQPRKIHRSGIWDAVGGRVLIYVHKEQMLRAVEQRYPARHYVMVDDKLRILDSLRSQWQQRVTTVFPRQGHYAHDTAAMAGLAPADVVVEHIRDLLGYDLQGLLGARD